MGRKGGGGKPLTRGERNGDWIAKVVRDGKDSHRSDTRSYIREVGGRERCRLELMCASGYERAGSRSELEMLLNNVYAKNCAHLIENVLLSLAKMHPPAVCVVCRYLVGEP
jgi:hypothetical protein